MKKANYPGTELIPQGQADDSITEGCIVLEGGAWKGVYTNGILDVLMQNNINFRTVVGISAGGMCGVTYLTGQIGWAMRMDLEYRHDNNYCGMNAVLHEHGVTGFHYLYTKISNAEGFNKKKFRETLRRLVVGATNMLTGEVEFFEKGKCNMSGAIRASATVPYVSRPVVIKGIPYLDGGCAVKIPYPWAKEQSGEKKIMVVKTREWDYRRDETPHKLAEKMYRKYPKFVEAIDKTNGDFNRMTDEIYEDYQAGKIFAIAPSKHVEVSRFESDLDKLADLYWMGYHDMEEHIDELKEYLGITK